jgi:DNA-binding SARP family transcriptional activator
VLATRERLQGRLLRLLAVVGTAHGQAGRYDDALVCFKKADEIGPLAEAPYRGLMQMNLDQGRHADVLLTYRRCRQMPSAGLGCAPSAETEALLRKAQVG